MAKLPLPLHRSLRVKLVFVSIIVEVAMFSLLMINNLRLLNQTLEEQTHAKVEAVTPLLDSAISVSLFERDHVRITEILNTLMKSQFNNFRYIVIYDNRGMVYAKTGDVNIKHMPALNGSALDNIPDGVYNTSIHLTLGGERVGEVRYGLSLQSLIDSRNNVIKQGLAIASIAVILTFILLSVGGFYVTRHLRALMAATLKLAAGENTTQIPVTSKDEIGLLATNFNDMSQAIRERIEALHRSEEALFEEKERAEVTLHSIGDGVITTDIHGLIDYINPIAEKLTGWSNQQALKRCVSEIYRTQDEATQIPMENPASLCLREKSVIRRQGRSVLVKNNGDRFPVEETASPILDHEGHIHGSVLVFHDVSANREFSRQLEYQATHDSLTGLFNRSEFERRVKDALQDARDHARQHVMCYLDLDQFKIVNDTCGHSAGDELLRQLAARLSSEVRNIDTIGRLGGDEFGLLIRKCQQQEAKHIVEGIRDRIREFRFVWNNKSFEIGVCIGVVSIRPDNADVSEIFTAADVACYIAKDKGRNQIHFHQIDDIEHARRQGEMQWSTRITSALKDNRFTLYYQEIVPLSSKAETGKKCELLVRIMEDDGKLILPAKFIGPAERYHQITSVDNWVVHNALSLISQIDSDSACFSINLSGQSMGDSEFLQLVSTEIRSSKIDPSRICFEVTETAAITNLNRASQFMSQLKALGCKFSLDDFGSGLSSFAYLKALPVDFLKIDGAFVKNIANDPNDRAMVTAINQVGHSLGILTIAEFVENQEILAVLREIGVDYAQGFFIHTPEALKIAGHSMASGSSNGN